MLLEDSFIKKYPKISGQLKNKLPIVKNDIKIWNAFTYIGNIDANILSESVTWGKLPKLKHTYSVSSDFWFHDITPNVIYIATEVANGLEQRLPSDEWTEFLIGKILHELVHWAHRNHGNGPAGPIAGVPDLTDQGLRFEYYAYGRALGTFPRNALASTSSATPGISPPNKTSKLKGKPKDKLISRGVRNNNPCNIKRGSPWIGLMDQSKMTPEQLGEKIFCVFDEPKFGIRATAIILTNYQKKYELKTVRAMITRWAPASDNNDPNSYAEEVARAMGIGPDTPFEFHQRDLALTMIRAMVVQENGSDYRDHYEPTVYEEGLSLAGIA